MVASSFSLSAGSLFLLGLASSTAAAPNYKLFETWQGESFLDYFNFHIGPDPTNGFVTYLDHKAAKDAGLVKLTESDSIYLGVDHKTKLSPSGPGRKSVRIGTKKYYGESLIIADIAHMPGAACGSWPAFWSTGQNWPEDGEIDIIEGINLQDHNEIVMHTAGTCSITDEGMTGAVNATGCGEDLGPVGCVIEGHKGSYGTSFNKQGGGVYAMEWTPEYLKIWFFPRRNIPASISKGKPDVSEFGMPMALVQDECDVAKSFKAQSFVFDVTFCGDWAGGVFGESGCPQSSPDSFQSCINYVAQNPAAFKETYWEINYVKVYQTVSEVPTTHATATHAAKTTAVTELSTSNVHGPEPTATRDAATHAPKPVTMTETSASHAPASEASAASVLVESPEAWHVIESATTTGGASPAGTVAPLDGSSPQAWKTEPHAIPVTPKISAATDQKPSTTRYITKLVTSTTTLCSLDGGASHEPQAALIPASADTVTKPVVSEATAAPQSAKAAEILTEQQSMSQVTTVITPAVAEITEATSPNRPNAESSVDAASNERSEATAAQTLPTVITGPGYNLGSASMLPSGHPSQTPKPVIPTPTRSSVASGGGGAGPSGTGAGAGPVFTGAADKLSAGLSSIAAVLAVAMVV